MTASGLTESDTVGAGIRGGFGLDRRRFMDEMNSDRSLQRVRAQIEGSEPFNVSKTPAVYVNGRSIRLISMPFWQAIIEGMPAGRSTSAPTTSRPTR